MVTTDPAYFEAIPWCATLLADSEYTVVPSRFSQPNKDKRGELFTRTLATDNTITACIYQSRRPKQSNYASSCTTFRPSHPIVSEARAFLNTASGVNGFPGIAHGGFVASIIDEIMSFLINSNKQMTEAAVDPPTASSMPATAPGSSVVTVELTIKYRKPVQTGDVLLLRTWIEKIEGRKIIVKATVEDSEKQILAEGLGFFIALKPGVKIPLVKRKSARI
ncbi:hypothetical protein VE03_03413 [Pseudogymnoascus sp. 23342-1-I1]|nr:hypothetical protein VE03_03413 [Pseudogymnoascus sp. 23342-1-I1]